MTRRRSTRVILIALLIAPAAAQAGGSNVSLAATPGHVWVATGIDVAELDARTGRVEHRYRARYPFTLTLGLTRTAVWVSSVEDGFVAGGVTRIPFDHGAIEHPLVRSAEPVLSLAVGDGTTWALIGPWTSTMLAAIDQTTRHVTLAPIRHVASIAADATGRTPGLYAVTTAGRTIRVGNGHATWTADTGPTASPPLVALGSVWVDSGTTLYRLDPSTGRTQATIPLDTRADGAFLTSGGDRVWLVPSSHHDGRVTYKLLEVDPVRDRVVARAPLAGPIGAIAYGADALWVAQAGLSVSILSVDPHSLKSRPFAAGLDETLVPIQSR